MDLDLNKLVDTVIGYYCQTCDNRTSFFVRVVKTQELHIFYVPDAKDWEKALDDDEETQIHIFCGKCGAELYREE